VGSDRKSLTTRQSTLTKELELLRAALAVYSENDPVELEKKKDTTAQGRGREMDRAYSNDGGLIQKAGCRRQRSVSPDEAVLVR